MFSREYIKSLARQRMSGGLGTAIVVCILLSLMGGNTFTGFYNFSIRFKETDLNLNFFPEIDYSFMIPVLLAITVFGIVYGILVGNVITIGCKGWFLRYWRGQEPPIGDIFSGFKSYTAFVSLGLLRGIYVFLWSLLFIIPGIVMSYAYSMADYILCEYPHLSASQALDLSKRITNGFKGELFLFELSFLGWYLLSLFTCGILGIVYVNPYVCTSHAGVYEALKFSALQRGVMRPEEFGMAPQYQQYPPYNTPYNY
ncbi:MAG TPA: DUF975 family protein [Candidatus Avimonas sp.]|nr:DUF975 family protein [Candidatus Avimonas sp.]